ncbi:PAS domain-containing protein [Niallia sp. RD1]|uniref:PAS domain-containing protein n=1 Tax=Niallia sp. RD1 TaxID=2962858 RepID=UPI0020C1ADCD|nr:PAS domain-containing protein [Niallia sp. RD1]UTI42670.1 PAS domain-containing protein [Niallia sp. RD1]
MPTLGRILQFIHPEDREKFEQTYRNAIKLKHDFKHEYRIQRKDGAIQYVIEKAN